MTDITILKGYAALLAEDAHCRAESAGLTPAESICVVAILLGSMVHTLARRQGCGQHGLEARLEASFEIARTVAHG